MNDSIVAALLQSFRVIVPEALLVLGACVLFLGGTFRASRNLWGGAALATLTAALATVLLTWPEGADPDRIAALITQLGADRFEERERAFEELDRIGAAALPPLREARDQRKDPEVRERARRLVEQIEGRVLPTIFASTLRLDRLSLFIKVVALAAGVVLVLVSWKELPDRQAAECFACILIITAGLSLVGSANDLVTLFVALELISIPSYVLLYLPRYDDAAQEAAMKYFLLSVFSSALLLFGFSYLYGLAGTTNLPAVAEALGRAGPTGLPPVALVALVMIVGGLGFRITAVPFHFYAPDVYQGTP
ncbi:MAG TPA: proton-conducting transporter membrane subunit, partial [Gemmataceae bacterium]|nr:proton-conducting transporter membrane subunit [Gemmataceae bacterium]